MEAEATVWSANAFTRRADVARVAAPGAASPAPQSGQRAVVDPATGAHSQAAVVERQALTAGAGLSGPAVITENETTVVVPGAVRLTALADGCLDLHFEAETAHD